MDSKRICSAKNGARIYYKLSYMGKQEDFFMISVENFENNHFQKVLL